MIKKLVVLCMVAALTLSACGSKTEDAKATPALAEVEEAVETKVLEEEPVVLEDEVAETENVTEEETVEETTMEEPKEAEYTKGIFTETGWESQWLGMRYVVSDGVVMSTEEELNAIMGVGQEMLSDDFSELQLKYAELNTVYEMMCTGADQVTNISVSVENVMIDMDTDTFVSAFKNTLSEVSAMTMTIVNEGEDVVVAEKEFKKLQCEVDYEGMSIFQDYYLAMKDKRAISIVVTYLDEAEAEKMLNGFQTY